MTGHVVPASCPRCRQPAIAAAGARILCPGCGSELFIVDVGGEELGARPRIGGAQAIEAFARLFERDGEPEAGPPPAEARLFFVPFFELSGTMSGSAGDRIVHRWAQASLPGIEDRDDIGLAEVDPARARDADLVRSPEDVPSALAELGVVLPPEGEPEEVSVLLAERLRNPADGEESRLLDRRLSVIYYPLWRLRYAVRGVTYQATIDALTGAVVAARVPAKQRRRIFNGVFAAACLGYVLGTMLRHPGMGIPGLSRAMARAGTLPLVLTLSLASLGLALYVLLLNAAWNSLRYRNELVYHSGLKTRVLVNRRAETALDRGTASVRALWFRVFGPKRFDR